MGVGRGGAGGGGRASLAAGGRPATRSPPSLGGADAMEAFGLFPGPEVGRLLERAREAQALGLVSTREDALAYLRRGGDPGA